MKQLGMRLRALREGIGLSQSKFADVIGSTPVAYTHLDVYKRQVWMSAKPTTRFKNMHMREFSLDCLLSVSYTHLDVYKRQSAH